MIVYVLVVRPTSCLEHCVIILQKLFSNRAEKKKLSKHDRDIHYWAGHLTLKCTYALPIQQKTFLECCTENWVRFLSSVLKMCMLCPAMPRPLRRNSTRAINNVDFFQEIIFYPAQRANKNIFRDLPRNLEIMCLEFTFNMTASVSSWSGWSGCV